jgi:hypothetical protein
MNRKTKPENPASPKKMAMSPKKKSIASPTKGKTTKTLQQQVDSIVKQLSLLDDPKGDDVVEYKDLIAKLNKIVDRKDRHIYVHLKPRKPTHDEVMLFRDAIVENFGEGNFDDIFDVLDFSDIEKAMMEVFQENSWKLFPSYLKVFTNGWSDAGDLLSPGNTFVGYVFERIASNLGLPISPIPAGESYEEYVKNSWK